jgi:pimeloyl-ACP methyl ester carboxylesterase
MTSAPATTPTVDHTLTHADGRRVGWAEWGDPHGQPVLFLHRNPGSRLLDPDSTATASTGTRLITIDRPGYGRTDPVADPTRSALAAAGPSGSTRASVQEGRAPCPGALRLGLRNVRVRP